MTNKQKNELTPTFKILFEKDALCSKYTPNKEAILTGHTDGVVMIHESSTGNFISSLIREDLTKDVPVTSIQIKGQPNRPDNTTILSTYTDGKVMVWDYETGNLIKELKEDRQTLGAAYHPRLPKFLTVGDDTKVMLYDEETMQCEHTYEKGVIKSVVDGHTSRVFAAKFHHQQPTEFVTGGWDSIVHFWDMRQPNSLRFIKGVNMCGEGLDISRTGRELLTCSYARDNALQLWHYHSGRLLANIEPDVHKCMLYCGQWITPDTVLTGGTDPNMLRIVSLKNLTTQFHYKGFSSGVYSCDYCVKGPVIFRPASKRDNPFEVKIAFTMDKSLIEADISL